MSKRKHFTPEQKVAIVRRHLLEGVPVSDLCDELGIAMHVDGARVCNSAVALGVSLKELCSAAESVSVCLSKGLGAPLGSVLVGDTECIRLAKRARRAAWWGSFSSALASSTVSRVIRSASRAAKKWSPRSVLTASTPPAATAPSPSKRRPGTP